MAKLMKSFRLDEWTAEKIEGMAGCLGVSQAELITIAVAAFSEYGIKNALGNFDFRSNDFTAYITLIDMSARSGSIQNEISGQIEACTRI